MLARLAQTETTMAASAAEPTPSDLLMEAAPATVDSSWMPTETVILSFVTTLVTPATEAKTTTASLARVMQSEFQVIPVFV